MDDHEECQKTIDWYREVLADAQAALRDVQIAYPDLWAKEWWQKKHEHALAPLKALKPHSP